MKNRAKSLCVMIILVFLTLTALPAGAVTVGLLDWAFNVDGTVYEATYDDLSDVFGVDYGDDFDDGAGLGTLTWTTEDVGDYTFIAFFDHEIDEDINTYFNEYGALSGTLAAGQSWEIDEPGYVFGDIYDNVFAGILDNTNSAPVDSEDDVSMAMGWDFTLAVDQKATISLLLSEVVPTSNLGIYLSQTDPEAVYVDPDTGVETVAPYSIYFSSTLEIEDTGGPGPGPIIPEPATIFLMGLGLAGLLGVQRRRKSRK